ncbi:hypothetical protein [Longimicrobium terrae]|uniref:Uncharacterized protein n=1 Tax=Longimicrobium terrae TaxID=1639882 RepID=A0A841GX20_9BACT|nr:hypothetical protein [Longimicrobium terrae]MBB4634841.1 hypothetical protein [Longimicrobium terrae]MBB6069236.1 hypothetical protein [Longimicrobium terrae]NNC31954.1 hypothetical protein [Longimicrobium terrae]
MNELSSDPPHAVSAGLDEVVAEMVEQFRRGAVVANAGGLGHTSFADVPDVSEMVNAMLSPADAEAFGAVSISREDGLRASRGGDQAKAAERIGEARRLLDGADLTPSARLLAESLYSSAAAYVRYRQGDLAGARRDLDEAIASSNALWDEHGFRGAEARRLHLAHLIVRVEARLGGDPWDVVQTVCRLWDYLEGNTAAWPFAPYARAGAEVNRRMAMLMLNEIVTEFAVLLAEHPEVETAALDLLHREQRARHPADPYPFSYARAWLTARQALHGDDPAAALQKAGPFLGVVDGPRPLLWQSVVRDTVRLCRTLPGAAGRAAETLAAGALADHTVPDCLRIDRSPHPA